MPRSLLLALLLWTGCTTTHPPQDAAAARDALMAADRAFAVATAARGLAGWMDFYAADAVRLYLGGPVAQGHDAIRTFDADLFRDPATRLVWEPTDAGVFADGLHGFTTGTSAFVRLGGATPDTPSTSDTLSTGRYVTLWRRSPAGTWQVILDTGALDR